MYLLLCLAFIGSAIAVPITTNVVTTNEDLRARYILPQTSYPTFYDVRLFIDPSYVESFYGNVSIRIVPNVNINEIVLQAMEMTIDSISVVSDTNTEELFANFTQATDDTHFLRIRLNRDIVALQPHNIHINYVSKFADNMFGVYVSTYEENGQRVNLVTSQLQPTFTRRAFPCYDEPAQKAIFRTTIYAPADYPVVRSNTIIRAVPLKENVAGYVKHEFEDTLVMSTYLIAYLVSRFEYVDNAVAPIYNVPFRVYSRPGTQHTAAFAMDFGQHNMIALEEYTEFPYAFPKMDKAAVPDFAAGAMENWGLVIYREAALLVQDGVTTTATKQNIGRIICHENMHMWFGNEVSPLSWTYTWLNEGFANLFENFATDLVLPEWRMMEQYVIAMQNVFQSDAVLSINPMTHEVITPSQIIGTFNAVAYQKSGSVIRMLQHFMTPELFRRGLVLYLRANSRRAVGPPSLYVSLQQAIDESTHNIPFSIATIMERWTTQGGFPVITVRKSAPNANSVFVAQERYLTDTSLSSTDRWHVPVNWVLSSNADFSDTRPQAWVPPSFPAVSIDIPGLSTAEWYIVNKQQTGYYRVNYDVDNWAALAKVLTSSHQTITILNRAQILDDSFNLARNGRLNYSYAFEISRYLVQEVDYIPWAAVNPAFRYLDVILTDTDTHTLYKTYLLNITDHLYDQLGFEVASDEEHVTPYHRNIALDIHCRLGNQACVTRAQELLQAFRNNPTQRLNPDIQQVVYCSGLRGGDTDNFNFLWDQYLASTDSTEQGILLNSLGCTSNAELRTFYLNQVVDDNSPVREQDRHTVIVSTINSSPENMDAALEFVIEHFHNIQPRVQGLTGTTNILNAFSVRLTTQRHAERINEFVRRHQAIFSAGEQASVAAIRENIAASIAWNDVNAPTVHGWLNDNFGERDPNSANTVVASFLVMVSIVIALFNN